MEAPCQIDLRSSDRGVNDLWGSQRRGLRGEGMAGPQHRSLYKITQRGPQVSIACIILWHQKLLLASVRNQYPVRWSSIKPNQYRNPIGDIDFSIDSPHARKSECPSSRTHGRDSRRFKVRLSNSFCVQPRLPRLFTTPIRERKILRNFRNYSTIVTWQNKQ